MLGAGLAARRPRLWVVGPADAGVSWDSAAPLSQEELHLLFLKASAASWEAKLGGPPGNARSCPPAQRCLRWERSSAVHSISMDFVCLARLLFVSCEKFCA